MFASKKCLPSFLFLYSSHKPADSLWTEKLRPLLFVGILLRLLAKIQLLSMSRFVFLCFIIIGNWGILIGQSSLSGLVVDSKDGRPIPFATVYFDGTTIGQTTDEKGQFTLSLVGIKLPAALVVSHLSYAPLSLRIDENTENRLEFALQPRNQTLTAVVIQDQNQRQKNLVEFRRLFLGTDAWGRRARIRNEEALVFSRDYERRQVSIRSDHMKRKLAREKLSGVKWAPDSSYLSYDKAVNLKASAKVPLLIELPDLGYILQLDLVSFQSDYKQGRTGHLGYYFFQAYEEPEGKARGRRQRNRERAYYHSSQHFLRALFADSLAENGYQLLEAEGESMPFSLKVFDPTPFLHLTGEGQMAIRGLNSRSLIIQYYADRQGRPLPESKWKRVEPIQSGIRFEADECLIRADGTMGDSKLLFIGKLGSRGVAWSLPGDYN